MKTELFGGLPISSLAHQYPRNHYFIITSKKLNRLKNLELFLNPSEK